MVECSAAGREAERGGDSGLSSERDKEIEKKERGGGKERERETERQRDSLSLAAETRYGVFWGVRGSASRGVPKRAHEGRVRDRRT